MHVIDHEPGSWFLLQEEEDYFLDVRCDRGVVTFSVDIRLTPEERSLYVRDGHDFITRLEAQIQATLAPRDPRYLRDRTLEERITCAIVAWNQQHR